MIMRKSTTITYQINSIYICSLMLVCTQIFREWKSIDSYTASKTCIKLSSHCLGLFSKSNIGSLKHAYPCHTLTPWILGDKNHRYRWKGHKPSGLLHSWCCRSGNSDPRKSLPGTLEKMVFFYTLILSSLFTFSSTNIIKL